MFIPYLVIPLGCSLMAWRSLRLIFVRNVGGGENSAGSDSATTELSVDKSKVDIR
jgi:hypothetical protein